MDVAIVDFASSVPHGRFVDRMTYSLCLVVLGVLVGGCAPTEEPVSAGTAASAFCAEFAAATCDLVERCACDAAAVARCRSEAAAQCASSILTTAALSSIGSGRLHYDGLEASRMIAALRSEPASCDYLLVTLGFRVGGVLTFGGLLEGTLAPGAACTELSPAPFPSECAVGLCHGGVCVAVPGPGEPCDGDSMCLDREAAHPGGRDVSLGLSCPITAGETMGVCLARQPGGAPCVNEQDCVTRICAGGVCAPEVENGGPCTSLLECASKRCGAGLCLAADAPDPSACTRDAACGTNECVSGACVPSLCGEF